jgi:hypothetical protein
MDNLNTGNATHQQGKFLTSYTKFRKNLVEMAEGLKNSAASLTHQDYLIQTAVTGVFLLNILLPLLFYNTPEGYLILRASIATLLVCSAIYQALDSYDLVLLSYCLIWLYSLAAMLWVTNADVTVVYLGKQTVYLHDESIGFAKLFILW